MDNVQGEFLKGSGISRTVFMRIPVKMKTWLNLRYLNSEIKNNWLDRKILLKKDCASDKTQNCMNFFINETVSIAQTCLYQFGHGGPVDRRIFELLI